MKNLLIICLSFFLVQYSFAQGEVSFYDQGIEGCYSDYYIAFTERGANEVPNGEHDVVISVINQGLSECYFGKAKVQDGQIVPPVMIQKDDLSFVPINTVFRAFDANWLKDQDQETLLEINDGMSKVFLTQDQYSVRLFFFKSIHPTPRANRRAPSADVLLRGNNR